MESRLFSAISDVKYPLPQPASRTISVSCRSSSLRIVGAWILMTKLGYPNAFDSKSVSLDLDDTRILPFVMGA